MKVLMAIAALSIMGSVACSKNKGSVPDCSEEQLNAFANVYANLSFEEQRDVAMQEFREVMGTGACTLFIEGEVATISVATVEQGIRDYDAENDPDNYRGDMSSSKNTNLSVQEQLAQAKAMMSDMESMQKQSSMSRSDDFKRMESDFFNDDSSDDDMKITPVVPTWVDED